MEKWIYIIVTAFAEYPERSNCHFFYDDDSSDLHLDQKLSYAEGMKALRKAEKLLGRSAKLAVNQFAPDICYKEIFGYIDRD